MGRGWDLYSRGVEWWSGVDWVIDILPSFNNCVCDQGSRFFTEGGIKLGGVINFREDAKRDFWSSKCSLEGFEGGDGGEETLENKVNVE